MGDGLLRLFVWLWLISTCFWLLPTLADITPLVALNLFARQFNLMNKSWLINFSMWLDAPEQLPDLARNIGYWRQLFTPQKPPNFSYHCDSDERATFEFNIRGTNEFSTYFPCEVDSRLYAKPRDHILVASNRVSHCTALIFCDGFAAAKIITYLICDQFYNKISKIFN